MPPPTSPRPTSPSPASVSRSTSGSPGCAPRRRARTLVACRGAAPPLPPIPPTAGPILLRAGDPPPVRDGETVVDRVVAVVNGEIITMSELEETVAIQRRDARPAPSTEKELNDLRRQVL